MERLRLSRRVILGIGPGVLRILLRMGYEGQMGHSPVFLSGEKIREVIFFYPSLLL
ncbi:hypothetical protein DSECCO2_61200 [anaerobic digester metagenome]